MNQFVFTAWNQAKGCFYPVHEKGRGENVEITKDALGWICETIKSQRIPQICINDTNNNDTSHEDSMSEINEAFRSILPEKSSFEKEI